MSDINQRNKQIAAAWFADIDAARPDQMAGVLSAYLSEDVVWQGFAPIGTLRGQSAICADFLQPFFGAFADLERDTHILMGGVSDGCEAPGCDGAHWVGATGYLSGRQAGPFLGIAAKGADVRLRWGTFLEFDANGRIRRIQELIDVIDWLEQLGCSPLPRPRGVPAVWPAPTGFDGVLRAPEEAAVSAEVMAFARAFIFGGLNGFDETDLASMGMAQYFHPNLKWYGPGGIGACLSFAEFETLHQAPWLQAFPDRKVGDLDNLITEGRLVGASSLPGVWLTHTGPYLDHAPSGARAGVNGIDFWLYDAGRFTENWVFVDMIHLFDQFGIDLLAQARAQASSRR